MRLKSRYVGLGLLSCLTTLFFWLTAVTPSQAHWADMAASEIVVSESEVQMTLTFPTGLAAFADIDQDGQLSVEEVNTHIAALQTFLSEKIRITNSENQPAIFSVAPLQQAALPPTVQAAPDTHSTLMLTYSWTQPVRGVKIHYDLFLPGVPTASCLTTILQSGQLSTFVFTPTQRSLSLTPGLASYTVGGVLLAIAGAFAWGAMHSMSPGHGKTVVGAYLVGARATPQHAIFLAITTTITHTIGVFALGLVTLFAAQYILPEQLYPWLSLFSGLMVAAIGWNLLTSRFNLSRWLKEFSSQVKRFILIQSPRKSENSDHSPSHVHDSVYALAHSHHSHSHHSHSHHSHSHHSHHDHPHPDHSHSHNHAHDHSSDHASTSIPTSHVHSHLPPGIDGPVTWRSLLALGISGGLVPCPAALVLLLSAIALGNAGLGLVLVLAFSAGLAIVLTGLGLLLVYAKRLFKQVPSQRRLIKILPVISALSIILIGFGISTRALMQVMSFG
jgi:nickel/cobalt exporter